MTRREWTLLAGLIALAALLRCPTLDAKSFWEDEAKTALLVWRDLPAMLGAIAERDANPPLFYLLSWGWAKLFGTGEAGLRSLSALFGVAAVPVGYLIGRVLGSPRTGLVTAALIAVNPLLVWYSQEARAYSLLVLLTALAFLFFARALRDPCPRELALWALFSSLSLATHYFAVFLVAPELLWLLHALGRRRAVLAAGVATLAVGAALAPLMLAQAGGLQGGPGWISRSDLLPRLVQIPGFFLVGFESPLPFVAAAAAGLLAGYGIWLLLRPGDEALRRRALLAAGIGSAGILLPLVLALVGIDYLVYKNVIGSLVPLTVAVAAGFAAPRAGRSGVAAAAGLSALSVLVVVATAWEPKYHREAWREAVQALGPPAGARAIVATPGHAAVEPLAYYLRRGAGARPLRAGRASVSEVDVLALRRRPLGALVEPRLPRGIAPEPPSPGFRLVERRDETYFRLYRYRASRPLRVTFEELERTAADAIGPLIVLQSAAPARPGSR